MAKLLKEILHSSFINHRIKLQVDVHKNPSRKDLNSTSKPYDGIRETGVFLHKHDMYAFDRGGTLHGEAAKHIEGHGKDHLPIYLTHKGDEAHALITDASRHTNWHHNPDADDYVQNHPQLTKHFKHISVSHWDDDIHDWHGDHND